MWYIYTFMLNQIHINVKFIISQNLFKNEISFELKHILLFAYKYRSHIEIIWPGSFLEWLTMMYHHNLCVHVKLTTVYMSYYHLDIILRIYSQHTHHRVFVQDHFMVWFLIVLKFFVVGSKNSIFLEYFYYIIIFL